MPYRSLKILLILFLLIYFLVGLYARTIRTEDEDLYPFFSWFLFSVVPARVQEDYIIKIVEYRGSQVNPPALVEKTSGIFNKSRSLAEYFQMTRNLGVAVSQGQAEQVKRLRVHIETNLFSGKPLTYAVYRVTYSPIERFKTGQLLSSQELAIFKSGVY